MYINIETHAQHTEANIKALFPNTSFPEQFSPPDGYAYIFPSPLPIYKPDTQRVVEGQPKQTKIGHWEQQWEIVKIDKDTIKANKVAKIEQDKQTVERNINALWVAASNYIGNFIAGDALTVLTLGLIKSNPKAVAVKAWSRSVWDEYYKRKELITAFNSESIDFTSCGPMPFSVREMQIELD